MKPFLSLAILLLVLTSAPSLAEDLTIYGEDQQVKGYLRGDTIYNPSWQREGSVNKDGRVYDKDGRLRYQIKDGRIFDKDWKSRGYIGKDGRIYNRDWKGVGRIKK